MECSFCGASDTPVERSQNTVLLASTQAVYKALHSTVRETVSHGTDVQAAVASSSRTSQSVRLEHNTLEPVAINASKDIRCIRCVQT